MDFIFEIIYIALAYRIYPPALIVGEQTIQMNAINRYTRPADKQQKIKKYFSKLTLKRMEMI